MPRLIEIGKPCRLPRLAVWLIVLALWGAPALLFATGSAWIGPLCLLSVGGALTLTITTRRFFAVFARVGSSKSPGRAWKIHAGLLGGMCVLMYVGFYDATDTWEIWTWLMHSSTQYGQSLRTEREVPPTLFEVLHNPRIGQWRGPHITHGLLHSTPMIAALKVFVREGTRRFTVNQIMRALNLVCALTGIPLFFLAFRRIQILRHVDVAALAALTSPGILIASGKGHWLGMSYGLAGLTLFVGVVFLTSGKWLVLAGFLAAWSLLLASYTSAQILFIVSGGMTLVYLLTGHGPTISRRRMAAVIGGALLVFYLLIGSTAPANMLRHFQGNGEALFEIRANQVELNRFAGYWQSEAPKYGLDDTLTLPLFYRAGLGMVARNLRAIARNFLGTGTFARLWLSPHHGEIKSFGFVLPWFIMISVFLITAQRRWRECGWPTFVLAGPAALIGLLLLLTWDMSIHRVFSINLLLAGFAGALYDQVFDQCRVCARIPFKYPLFIALYGQLLLYLLFEKLALGV